MEKKIKYCEEETIFHNGHPKFKVGDIIQHSSGQIREIIIVNYDSYIVKCNYFSLHKTANQDDFNLLK